MVLQGKGERKMKKVMIGLLAIVGLLALQLAMLGLYSLGGWDLMLVATVLITMVAATTVPNLLL